MPSQYQRALNLSQRTDRAAQRLRYDNLAIFVAKIVTRNGEPIYTVAYWRDRLQYSRVLTKDGDVLQKRIENLLKRHHFKGTLTKRPEGWEYILEGLS